MLGKAPQVLGDVWSRSPALAEEKFLKDQIEGGLGVRVDGRVSLQVGFCEDALAGGVTTSLALDAHGKTLSSALLEMEIER